MSLDLIQLQQVDSSEARRVMTICNACRYCEGLCASFQAMTDFREFADADLSYLANLCHNCTACYHDCQYAPPHEFGVNVPATFSDLRVSSYAEFAWPAGVAASFARNGLVVSLLTCVALMLVLLAGSVALDADVLFAAHTGSGAFYKVVSHQVMVGVGALTFGFAVLSMAVSAVRFWRALDSRGQRQLRFAHVLAAGRDVASLRYLNGGHGHGCQTRDDQPGHWRRAFHQVTMWGFLLCFAATCVATVYDYGLGRIAPYPFFSLPVMLGVAGGAGLLVGPVGLAWIKWRSDPAPVSVLHLGMDYAFLCLLWLISASGLLLLALRDTSAMGILLLIHLGLVLGFFLTLPYSKFVHGIYRSAALLHFAATRSRE